MIADEFYEAMVGHLCDSMKKQKIDKEPSAEKFVAGYIGFLAGSRGEMEDTARHIADVGLLVCGACQVVGQSDPNPLALMKIDLDSADIEAAIKIYDDLIKGDVKEVFVSNMARAFKLYSEITGRDEVEFTRIVRESYNSAYGMFPQIEIPKKKPGVFFLKVVERQKLDEDILKIEEKFLNTTKEEWVSEVSDGDISAYTVPLIVREIGGYGISPIISISGKNFDATFSNIMRIGDLTALPVIEIIKANKQTFPNTKDWKDISEKEKIRVITKGLDGFLGMLKKNLEKKIKEYGRDLYKDEIKDYGRTGAFFSVGFHHDDLYPLNKEIRNWEGGICIGNQNKYYTSFGIAFKIRTLLLDGVEWKDISTQNREWYELAVNESLEKILTKTEKKLEKWKAGHLDIFDNATRLLPIAEDMVKPEIKNKHLELRERIASKV